MASMSPRRVCLKSARIIAPCLVDLRTAQRPHTELDLHRCGDIYPSAIRVLDNLELYYCHSRRVWKRGVLCQPCLCETSQTRTADWYRSTNDAPLLSSRLGHAGCDARVAKYLLSVYLAFPLLYPGAGQRLAGESLPGRLDAKGQLAS